MSKPVKLIDYAFFRATTDISDNVDDKVLDHKIILAMEQLKFIIGTPFYTELFGQYPSGFTPANLAFYDPYVKQFLAWQAYVYYAVRANIYETRTGFREFKEENSDVASDKTMGEMIKNARQLAESYKGQMLIFLRQQKGISTANYPLYTDTCGDKMGSGFAITAVSKNKADVYFKINRKTINNGY